MTPNLTLQTGLPTLDAEDATSQSSTKPVTLNQQAIGRLSRMNAVQKKAMPQAQARRRAGERLRINAALKRIEESE
ncbi:MAG: hypothetical protein AAF744_10655 [Pseudomonadota bacterium]